MQDSKHQAITQTIHMNLMGLFFEAGCTIYFKFFCKSLYNVNTFPKMWKQLGSGVAITYQNKSSVAITYQKKNTKKLPGFRFQEHLKWCYSEK